MTAATARDGHSALVTGGAGFSCGHLSERLVALVQTGARVEPIHTPAREGDVRDSLASLGRSRELLGYEPSVGLEEGLRMTIGSFEKAGGQ